MQLTLENRPLAEALYNWLDPWLALQRFGHSTDNSNWPGRAARHLEEHPDSTLEALVVHDGRPMQQLYALLVVEPDHHWLPKRRCHQNWIAQPGLDSAPLIDPEQRFSALDCLLQGLDRLPQPSRQLALRHLKPDDPIVDALRALCHHRGLPLSCTPERRGSLLECRCQTLPATRRERRRSHPMIIDTPDARPH